MTAQTHRPARLALEDGAVFQGSAFGGRPNGPHTSLAAECVFNTAMCGYQEALTDPSYCGQILVMTAPMIGNYGVNARDVESPEVRVSGFVVRELARRHSNFGATDDLDHYLRHAGVLGLAGIDTRALTRRLRTAGVMRAVISDDPRASDADLVRLARSAPRMDGQNLVPLVAGDVRRPWPSSRPQSDDPARRRRIWAIDCGAKQNIFRSFDERGCDVTVIPHDTPGDELLRRYRAGEYDAIVVSNGPGDPAAVAPTIGALRTLLAAPADQSPPILGICLGHQLLALALGATTYKLKFGHRGANQPVRNALSGRVEITSQNHGFAVDEASLRAAGGEPTHTHLNDGSLAGFRLRDRPVLAVQHHPEACPGPHDAAGVFDQFLRLVDAHPHPAGSADEKPKA